MYWLCYLHILQSIAVHKSQSVKTNYFVFYIFKYKLHWTNAVKVPWPGYTKTTEKEEKTCILCTFLVKLSVKVNCVTRVQMYSHSTLLSRKMDSKPFNSLEAVKCGKSVTLKDWASCYIRKHLNCKCLNCGDPWVQAREYQPILCTLQGTPGWVRETTKRWFCSSDKHWASQENMTCLHHGRTRSGARAAPWPCMQSSTLQKIAPKRYTSAFLLPEQNQRCLNSLLYSRPFCMQICQMKLSS